ncbi:MAG: molybdopterin cofactor-binding domain-containing protein [Thermodesulfobacteriota bacterium]
MVAKAGYSVVGQPLPRQDAAALAKGEARFSIDISMPGMLFGKVLRSPLAHAMILNIDTRRAKKHSGVKAVITQNDLSAKRNGYWIKLFGINPVDKLPLADGKVRYIGDEVAAVAALDEYAAQEALDLIEVDYQELPAVFNPEEAMSPEAPLIHEKERNISTEIHRHHGDVERGFRSATYIREDRFYSPPVSHCALEPHNCLAYYDSSTRLTIWAATQCPIYLKAHISQLLGINPSRVRVVTPHVGGGFGSRAELMGFELCACILSIKSRQPVRITLSREEVFSTTRVRHPQVIDLKTGVRSDGTIMAQQAKLICDNGAYDGRGPVGLFLSTIFLTAPFRLPNFKCDSYLVYTNNVIGGPMRGFGAPQVRLAADSQLDMIARDLSLDTLDVMLRNAIKPGEKHPHFNVTSLGISQAITKVGEVAQWKSKRGKMKPGQGIGIAGHIHESGVNRNPYLSYTAEVRVLEDGHVTLLIGATDVGQGARTILAQIAAEELGVFLDDVTVAQQDTDITPLDQVTSSSRVTFWTGNAVKAAAAEARKKLFEAVAEELEARVDDLISKERRIYVKGSPDRRIPFEQAVSFFKLRNKGDSLFGHGLFSLPVDPLNISTGEGRCSSPLSSGATIAEVDVDSETGEVRVLRIITAHDCGFAINPLSVHGQIEGAALMGKGYAVSELTIREKGCILNPSFLEYKAPTSCDAPELISLIVEENDPLGPFGAKECGEGPLISIAPAIANAIHDALGVRVATIPLTPDRILNGLSQVRR